MLKLNGQGAPIEVNAEMLERYVTRRQRRSDEWDEVAERLRS
jgi:hypothetical protein